MGGNRVVAEIAFLRPDKEYNRPQFGSVSKLSVGVQTDGTYKGRLSLRSLPVGETDAPAPVRAKERAKGEGEGCSQRVVPLGGLEPLTLILSPWPMGEAKQTRWD